MEIMSKTTRRKLLALGLGQLDGEGLRQVAAWTAPMLLDGCTMKRREDGLW